MSRYRVTYIEHSKTDPSMARTVEVGIQEGRNAQDAIMGLLTERLGAEMIEGAWKLGQKRIVLAGITFTGNKVDR